MAVQSTAARISRGLYITFGGVRLADVSDLSTLPFEGSVPQIDVSTFASTGREYEPGLAAPGEVAMTILNDPTDPVFTTLKQSAASGSTNSLRIVFGRTADDSGAALATTDGKGETRNANVAVTAVAASGGTQTLNIASAVANGLRGVRAGMQVVKYAATLPNNAVYATITSVTETATGISLVVNRDTTIAAGSGAINIVRPAVEWQAQAYVSTFEGSASIDAAVSTNLSFQVSGSPTITSGAPDITL